jgi:hypothetical protein
MFEIMVLVYTAAKFLKILKVVSFTIKTKFFSKKCGDERPNSRS